MQGKALVAMTCRDTVLIIIFAVFLSVWEKNLAVVALPIAALCALSILALNRIKKG